MTSDVPFEPRLEVLPEPQRVLWDELGAIPAEFVLYGGTGLALKLSFFGVPRLARLREPHIAESNGSRVASLLDLAGTKASVVQQRAEAKDYIDIDAILTDGRINLAMALSAAQAIYGRGFNPLITLKALSYFEDGDLGDLPTEVKARLAAAVGQLDPERLPDLAPR